MPISHEEALVKINAFDRLIRACGYVQNGSDEQVVIFQDDATFEWHIKIGRNHIREYHGLSLIDAIDQIPDSDLED